MCDVEPAVILPLETVFPVTESEPVRGIFVQPMHELHSRGHLWIVNLSVYHEEAQ